MKLLEKIETGSKFGYLTTTSETYLLPNGQKKCAFVSCICQCGTEKSVAVRNLKNKTTVSCGCYHKKVMKSLAVHNLHKEPIYKVWSDMLSRCRNKSNSRFMDYGGRGIIVCDEWAKDVVAFNKWALKNGWVKGLQIDRIDNNGNYEPSNCRIVTAKLNSINKRNTIYISIKGETKPLSQWCEELGLIYSTVVKRYKKGCTPENILKPTGIKSLNKNKQFHNNLN